MSKLKVLMFGWEFPPYKSGGLGTACYGLTKALAKQHCEVTFVMPVTPEGATAKFVKLIGAANIAKNVKIKTINSPLKAYMTSTSYEEQYHVWGNKNKKQVYGKDLYQEVQRYAQIAKHLAKTEPHDVIHAHDWMTYQAGINAKKISKKPLVVHLHATEFDRTADHPDGRISHIEWQGLKEADKIITNSNFCKQNIIKHYKIPAEKIEVVHWGIDDTPVTNYVPNKKDKTILFLGRVTVQKGPDYFVEVAKKVLQYEPKTKFVIVGDGDMLPKIINKTAELEITDKVIFTGALSGDDVHKAFQTADLYVMPSVSEPFGLVALESLKNGTPVLISKQSGVSEVLNNALKADFWDINEMTNKIVSVLKHDALREELKEKGTKEVQKCNLDEPARKIMEVYKKLK